MAKWTPSSVPEVIAVHGSLLDPERIHSICPSLKLVCADQIAFTIPDLTSDMSAVVCCRLADLCTLAQTNAVTIEFETGEGTCATTHLDQVKGVAYVKSTTTTLTIDMKLTLPDDLQAQLLQVCEYVNMQQEPARKLHIELLSQQGDLKNLLVHKEMTEKTIAESLASMDVLMIGTMTVELQKIKMAIAEKRNIFQEAIKLRH